MIRAALILILLTFGTLNSHASDNVKIEEQIDNQDFDYNNMIIVRVDLGSSLTLSEALVGYRHKGNIFLSFTEFTQALDFPINVNDDLKTGEGWFISTDKKFNFDLENLDSVSNKKEHKINPNHFKIFDDELFVDIQLLQKWFPVEIEFDPFNQLIKITSLDPLPVENKAERENRWNDFHHKKNLSIIEENIQTKKAPYRLATVPLADIRYRYDYSKDESSKEDYLSELGIVATGDLLYLNHNLYANIDKGDGVSQVRLRSGKEDLDPVLLGPLKAREFAVGDIYNQQIPLIARSEIGKGAMVSNYPQNYVSEFDSVIIRGDIQNDWQVELYRNNSLINFQEASEEGIYEFLDVPLISGLNIMKLVFYGPHGERREEERRYMMDPDLVKKNKFHYRLSANKHNEDLIRVNKKEDDFGNDVSDGKTRYVGDFEYGIARSVSVLGSFSHIPIQGDNGNQRNYSNIGLKSSLLGVSSRFDIINDLTNHKYALQASLQTKLKSYDFSLKHAQFQKDFSSEIINVTSNSLENESSLRINGPISIPKLKIMRFSLRSNREYFSSKKEKISNDLSLSFPASRKLNVTQDIDYDFDERIVVDTRNLVTGRTFFNYRIFSNLIARSAISYNISPTEELTNSNLNIDYYLKNKTNLGINVVHQFANSTQQDSTNYIASVSKIFNKYRTSLGANYNDRGSYGISLTASLSFGYDPRYSSSIISNTPMSDNGSVSAKVFIDEDNNSKYDQGEELLPDMSFKIDGRKVKDNTDKNGNLLIGNIASNKEVTIELDPSSLDDPYLFPSSPKVNVISHSGSIDYLEFGVVNTGEIEGTVSILKRDKLSGVSNVLLELVNDSGQIIKTTLSSFDGFYLFDKVPLGNYHIRISKEQLSRLSLQEVDFADIKLTNDEYLAIGIDFEVKPQEQD